jgi:hypothetical protein
MDFFVWLETSPVGAWINESSSVLFAYPGILLIHTFGLTLLVGSNLVIGLRILGFAPNVAIRELRKLFPLIWTGLILSVTSGLLLLTAKATTMIANPAFVIKMVAVILAVFVVFRIKAKVFDGRLPAEESVRVHGKALAFLSLGLWFAAIMSGRMMAYVGEAAHFGALILSNNSP